MQGTCQHRRKELQGNHLPIRQRNVDSRAKLTGVVEYARYGRGGEVSLRLALSLPDSSSGSTLDGLDNLVTLDESHDGGVLLVAMTPGKH